MSDIYLLYGVRDPDHTTYWTDCNATHQESIKEQYLVHVMAGILNFLFLKKNIQLFVKKIE